MRERFRQFANDVACAMGSGWAFTIALFSVIAWAITGPIFGFSDTWQLVINTATTIITFLMVFLIQATQNRDSKAIQLKLDELLRAVTKARTGLVGLEHLPESEIQELEAEFATLKGDGADELSTAQRYPIPGCGTDQGMSKKQQKPDLLSASDVRS
jgi:low affinity Fe/Cu permease